MNNTGTKQVSIMKQTAFSRKKNGEYRACLKYSVPVFVEYIYIYKMQRLEVSGAVRPVYGSLGVKRLINKIVSQNSKQNIALSMIMAGGTEIDTVKS